MKWKLNGIDFQISPQNMKVGRRKRFHIIEIIDGNPVFQEGREEVPVLSAEITILSESAYTQFMSWYQAGIQTLVDDHGDSFEVVIESLDLDRSQRASHNWYYTGTISFRVFSGLD